MAGYGKLWSGITESSLWGGSKEARLLFVTLLAKADSVGFVEAAPSGLARLANLSREEVDAALAELTSPDPESKSKVADGRRVAIVPMGVCVVNYEEYRKRRDDEERKEYMREYMRTYRAQKTTVLTDVNTGKQGKPALAKAEAEAEAGKDIQSPLAPGKRVPKKKAHKEPGGQSLPEILGSESENYWAMSSLWSGQKSQHKAIAKCYLEARKEFSAEHIQDALKQEVEIRGKYQGRLLDWFENEAYRAHTSAQGAVEVWVRADGQ